MSRDLSHGISGRVLTRSCPGAACCHEGCADLRLGRPAAKQGEAYRGLIGTSSASASDVIGCAWPGALEVGGLLAERLGKLALKLRYSSSLGFCDVVLRRGRVVSHTHAATLKFQRCATRKPICGSGGCSRARCVAAPPAAPARPGAEGWQNTHLFRNMVGRGKFSSAAGEYRGRRACKRARRLAVRCLGTKGTSRETGREIMLSHRWACSARP